VKAGARAVPLKDFDAMLMRKDPPFDSEYFYATHLLEQAEREGARVFNKPGALRDHPEKLAIMEFPQFIGPTLVTRDEADIRAFMPSTSDIILKPLDGMGGMGIFRVGPDGLNLGSITETLNRHGAQSLMVQKFLPEIAEGDKRVLVIGGKPVPFCLARIPQGSEVRGNLAAGGKGVARPISAATARSPKPSAPCWHARGLLLVGLDVIGDCLTEINVTSPTCFRKSPTRPALMWRRCSSTRWRPDLPRYVGLSGPLHGLAAAMVVDHLMRRRRGAPVRPVTPGDGVIALLGAGLAAKLLLEASWRQPVAWDASLEMTVIMAAHLSGTMAGGVAALLCAYQGAEARKGTPKPALMEKTQ
jgi:glutathione synthase